MLNRAREHKVFFLIFIISGLVFIPFFGEHWVHDTYLVARYGYGHMIPRLFNQGRVIASLFQRGLDAVPISYTTAMSISVLLSLVFLSLASYLVYVTAKEHGVSGKLGAATALIGSAGIFFNLFVVETLMFFESAAVSFGALTAVLAARAVLRGKYVPAFILAVVSVFCYQAVIAYFLPLVLLFPTDRRKKIIAFAVYATALVTNYGFTRLISTDARVAGTVNIWANITGCYYEIRSFLSSTLQMTPKFLFFAFIFVFAVIITYQSVSSKKIQPLLRAAVACGALVVCAMLPHVMMSYFYVMPRSALALAGVGGLLVVAIAQGTGERGERREERGERTGNDGCVRVLRVVSLVLAVVFTVIIAGFQLDMQISSIRNNRLDAVEIALAAEEIRKYEAESGFVITHVYLLNDSRTVFFRPDFRKYHDLTIRTLSVSWMVAPHFSDALGRELSDLPTPEGAFERLFAGREWDDFDPEQMVFEDNFLYFCIY